MMVTLIPRHQELGLAGGAEQVRGKGPAVSQLIIAEDVMRLLLLIKQSSISKSSVLSGIY